MAAQGQQLQNQRYQMETALLDQILNSPSANEQSMLIAHLRALRGQEEPRPDNSLEKARYGVISDLHKTYSERQPLAADNKTPIPFEQWAAPALEMLSAGQQPVQQGGQQAGKLAVVVRNPKTGKTLYQDAAGNYFTD